MQGRVCQHEAGQPRHVSPEGFQRGQESAWQSEREAGGREHHHRAHGAHPKPETGAAVAGSVLLRRRLDAADHGGAGHRLGSLLDPTEHAAEDEFVQRHDGIPVENAKQSTGAKAGRHDQPGQGWLRLGVDLLDREVELRLARQFHLRPEGK